MPKSPSKSQFRFVTPAVIRRLARHNRGAFLPLQIVLLVDANADSDGKLELRRTALCRVLGCRQASATLAVRWLQQHQLVTVESERGKPWLLRINPLSESAEPGYELAN